MDQGIQEKLQSIFDRIPNEIGRTLEVLQQEITEIVVAESTSCRNCIYWDDYIGEYDGFRKCRRTSFLKGKEEPSGDVPFVVYRHFEYEDEELDASQGMKGPWIDSEEVKEYTFETHAEFGCSLFERKP